MIVLVSQIIFKGEERFIRNIKQLTFAGENAEAYFSPKGDKIVFQSKGEGGLYFTTTDTINVESFAERKGIKYFKVKRYNDYMYFFAGVYDTSGLSRFFKDFFIKPKSECDQIYIMDTFGYVFKKVSPGGANTCSWFIDDKRILFASTFGKGHKCPKNPYADEYLKKGVYVWRLFDYDLYIYDLENDSLYRLFSSKGYDAEGEGNYGNIIVFTSSKDGDLELYTLNLKTKEVKRITNFPGYDGGAMFSPSGRYIVFRAHHLRNKMQIKEFQMLLSKGLVRPEDVEIFIYDTKTKKFKQITHSPKGVSNFAPYFHPSEKFIIFSSNLHKPGSFSFELYKVDIDGKNLQRITYSGGFNAFPMFSKDGKRLIWTSNRNAQKRREFNIFMAEWVGD